MLPVNVQNDLLKILKELKPKQVILFGSYAKESARLNSDVDIFVVKKATPKKLHKLILKVQKKLKKFEKKYSIEVDLFVDTPSGIRYRLDVLEDPFYTSIFDTGVTLYEKNVNSEIEDISDRLEYKKYFYYPLKWTETILRGHPL